MLIGGPLVAADCVPHEPQKRHSGLRPVPQLTQNMEVVR